jgi:DNA-binding response OmpR family regulator
MKDHKTSHAGEFARPRARSRAAPSHRILLVDDDIDIRLLSADLLFHSGYQVDTAGDGESGWEALQARNYDLLITDNKMPKVSGLELVKKLRSARMALPVILASGAMPEELNRLPWLQLTATLWKPFTPDELLGTVKKVLCATAGAREQIEPLPIWRSQPLADALWLI